MAISGADEALAELDEFAGAEIDDAWLARAFSLRRNESASPEDSVVRLRIIKRLESVVQALRIAETARFATEMSDDERFGSRLSCADMELAIAQGISPRAAANRIISSQEIVQLPMTLDRMQRGLITEQHALALLRLAAGAHANGEGDPDYGLGLLAKCEPEIYAGRTQEPNIQQLRSKARRKMLAADPKAFSTAAEKAAELQDVTIERDAFKAMSWVTAYMPIVDAETVMSAVRAFAAAARINGDERPIGQLRVAAIVDWASKYLTGDNAPRAHGRPVEIGVTAPIETVMRLSDAPGELPGFGLIPADVIRDLARDAKMRLLAVDGDTGRLLDCGRETYRPPADLAKAVISANPIGLGPFSETPADRCDLDHNDPWDDDGETNYDNLAPLDRHIHRAKTLAGWRYEMDDDTNEVVWTSGLGQVIYVDQFTYDIPDLHIGPALGWDPDP